MHLVCVAYTHGTVKTATIQLAARKTRRTFVSLGMVVITFKERAVEPVCQHASHSTAVQRHAVAKRQSEIVEQQCCADLLPEPETPPIT